jgi:hypothetical protein
MKFKLITFLVLAAMAGLFILPGFVDADTSPPAEGGVLPPIDLGAPQSADYQQYLGIGAKKVFTIPMIKAEVVLIEIFSMY